jgi:hypothetical protein
MFCLILIIVALIAHHVEELQGIFALLCADHTQPVAKLLLLEELLGQVLEIAAAELLVGHNFDPAVAEVGDRDGVAEVAGAAIDLDALLEESGEGGWVEDAIGGWLGCVDHELRVVSVCIYVVSLFCEYGTFLVTLPVFFEPAPFRPPPPAVGLFCTHTSLSTLISSLLHECRKCQSRRRRAAKRDTYCSCNHCEDV